MNPCPQYEMGNAANSPRFEVFRDQYARLVMWFWFLPRQESSSVDKALVQFLMDGRTAMPGGAMGSLGRSLLLGPESVGRLRIWFEWVPFVVQDLSDEEYAERLDAFMEGIP